ncbi:MAG TPA: TraM recognition domain-containing protein [Halococcus sp.]|nr:TraM recognition domain-containing protein [Halococcus sp.]
MSLTRFRLKAITLWLVGLGLLAGAVVSAYKVGSIEFADEFAALTLQRKAMVGGGAILGVMLVGEVWTRSTVDFSGLFALGLGIGWFVNEMQVEDTEGAKSGREVYYSGYGDSIRRSLTYAGEGAVEVDRVDKRSRDSSVHPTVDREVSMMFIGQTNTGKSTQVKKQLDQWNLDEPVIAHAISERGEYNELGEALNELGADTAMISSRDSDVRWDPFLDRGESIREMINITEGVFRAHHTSETGWSDAARAMLTAAITLTNAKHGDFAALTDVIEQGPDSIIEELNNVPNTGTIHTTLDTLDGAGRSAAFTTMTGEIHSLLESDIFDSDLDRVSLGECFAADGRAIVLDNVQTDRYARGFWRFFVESAIDQAFSAPGRQQFVLDEVDKLPEIGNLENLASAGRSSGVRGILVAQDVHQLDKRYGDMAESIWSNCPNRIAFRAGDVETAEFVLSSLGEVELRKTNVSSSWSGDEYERSVSDSYETGLPLTTGDLTNLEKGEALVQSTDGWWLCKLSE